MLGVPAPRARSGSVVDSEPVTIEDVDLEAETARTAEAAGTAQPEQEELRPALDESIAMEPTAGAIASALGSVLPAARRCVVGHDGPSTASVVFGAEGRVLRVSVSGPATGTGAEGCIQGALGQMRVQRFARPEYPVRGITIRP